MSVKRAKGPVFDPGLCRCCGSLRKCRVLNVEYDSSGQSEVYCDMIMDCFGLLLAHMDGRPTERLICAPCVQRLREAAAFRRQVLRCEELFIRMKMEQAGDHEAPGKVEVEVKQEPCGDALADDDYQGNVKSEDDDSNDDLPLQSMVTTRSPPRGPTARSPPRPPAARSPPRPPTAAAPPPARKRRATGSVDVKPAKMVPASPPAPAQPGPPRAPGAKARPPSGGTQKPVGNAKQKTALPMSRIQQLVRERDPTYKTESNLAALVELSYAVPFRCRHNHLLCYYCGRPAPDAARLRDHTLQAHSPAKFRLTEHNKMVKLEVSRIDCRLCDARIDSVEEFRRHAAAAHARAHYPGARDAALPFRLAVPGAGGALGVQCALCDAQFPYFHALNKHMNVHYSNYVCETCGLGFVDGGRFAMHQQRHAVGDYPCETCGKVFKAAYNRELHRDRVHRRRGRVYCPKCDARLMSYPQKLKHLVEVHGEQPLAFPCALCPRVCATRRMLTIHRRKDHLKDYRYECQVCGQKFFTRFALTNHLPVHTGERNFRCEVCSKSYPRRKTLQDHLRIHAGDRRYRCHACPQAFVQNCSLKGHIKSQHPEYG